jgi:Zn-dependent protease
MEAVVILLGWVFSVCLHEYAHALTAWYGGDHTVEEKGYLDFNPFAYAHPILSIGLPILFLLMGGLPLMGGAVYIDHTRIRNRHWDAGVSAAGPAADLLLAGFLSLPFLFGIADPNHSVWQIVACLIFLNIFVAVINLVPVPGVDGFGILRPYLPRAWQDTADEIAPYGVFVLFGVLRIPGVGEAVARATFGLLEFLGVPVLSALQGLAFLDVLRLKF